MSLSSSTSPRPATARSGLHSGTPRPTALYLVDPRPMNLVYGADEQARLGNSLNFVAPAQTKANHASLGIEQRSAVEVIVTSWGMPRLTSEFLSDYPNLKAVFYGAGSVRDIVTPESWKRGVRIITAATANALPVAEFAFAHVILGLKRTWAQAIAIKKNRRFARTGDTPTGTYGSTVGLLALGHVGRLMAERLKALDVNVLGCDPYISAAEARDLNVQMVSLDELFVRSDAVSCHLPLLPKTEKMIRGSHFATMRPNAVFINTARGEVIAEEEMVDVLRQRSDLLAVIDVTSPEPPLPGCALYDLPNVILTPHIAGSLGMECRRLGVSIADDVERYVRGEVIPNEIREAEAVYQA